MPTMVVFNLEIGGYCGIGSVSCGDGLKWLLLVNTELNCAFTVLALSAGVSFKIPF